jgi:hypothetical protein
MPPKKRRFMGRSHDIALNPACIPHDFNAPCPAPFDQGYTQALFACGAGPRARAAPGVSVESR